MKVTGLVKGEMGVIAIARQLSHYKMPGVDSVDLISLTTSNLMFYRERRSKVGAETSFTIEVSEENGEILSYTLAKWFGADKQVPFPNGALLYYQND